jgi:DNA (cytosine-5)-methyltransferase 1
MNYLDLFHGIGGFALGAYWAGMKFENHYCSDIEPYCQKLYAQRFPDSIQLGDITKIDTSLLPKGEWIISGGFPCQDISIAGKGVGIHGERSSLWFEYWRIINDLRPRFAIMENVGMLIHRGLREVLGSLAEIGYNAEWTDIRASDVGAPHKRERIWIVAYPNEPRCNKRDIRRVGKVQKRTYYNKCEIKKSGSKISDTESNVADPDRKHDIRGAEPQFPTSESREERNKSLGLTTIAGLEREVSERPDRREPGLSAEHGGWDVEPAICGVVDGIPDELERYKGRVCVKPFDKVNRLKGLGNSIVPQIAEILFLQIKELL